MSDSGRTATTSKGHPEPRPRQRRRREIWWPLRYALIAALGALTAVAVTYLLRKAGY